MFADTRIDRLAAGIAAVIDPGFLTEAGWDPARRVLSFAPEHPLLGRPVCRAAGCSTTAPATSRICASCRRRLAEHGLGDHEVGALPAWSRRSGRGPDACLVGGCARDCDVGAVGAVLGSRGTAARVAGLGVEQFLTHRQAQPLPPLALCAVAACTRQRRHRDGLYCGAHQLRLRTARTTTRTWTKPAGGRSNRRSGAAARSVCVACRRWSSPNCCSACSSAAGSTRSRPARPCCGRSATICAAEQLSSLTDYLLDDDRDLEFTGLAHCLVGHARRALSTPETEVAKDDWDLVVFGHSGTLSFTGISQSWLRESAKRWAADDLPKRRVRPGRRTSAGLAVRHHVGCLARLSESLRMRADRGDHPAALGRADMEAFLHRLAYRESVGQISGDARIRACREVRAVLTRIRTMGLTRPGGLAAGLGEDFTITVADVPAEPEPGEPNRDLPRRSCGQLCAHLDRADLAGDAHRHRAGHRHRPPPGGDLRPWTSTAWPATTRNAVLSTTTTKPTDPTAGCRSASRPRP